MLKKCSAPYYNFYSGTLMDEKRIFWDTLENCASYLNQLCASYLLDYYRWPKNIYTTEKKFSDYDNTLSWLHKYVIRKGLRARNLILTTALKEPTAKIICCCSPRLCKLLPASNCTGRQLRAECKPKSSFYSLRCANCSQ